MRLKGRRSTAEAARVLARIEVVAQYTEAAHQELQALIQEMQQRLAEHNGNGEPHAQ